MADDGVSSGKTLGGKGLIWSVTRDKRDESNDKNFIVVAPSPDII